MLVYVWILFGAAMVGTLDACILFGSFKIHFNGMVSTHTCLHHARLHVCDAPLVLFYVSLCLFVYSSSILWSPKIECAHTHTFISNHLKHDRQHRRQEKRRKKYSMWNPFLLECNSCLGIFLFSDVIAYVLDWVLYCRWLSRDSTREWAGVRRMKEWNRERRREIRHLANGQHTYFCYGKYFRSSFVSATHRLEKMLSFISVFVCIFTKMKTMGPGRRGWRAFSFLSFHFRPFESRSVGFYCISSFSNIGHVIFKY